MTRAGVLYGKIAFTYGVLFLLFGLGAGGCYTSDGWLNPSTGEIYSPDEAQALPTDIQTTLVKVQYTGIKPDIEKQIDSGLEGLQSGLDTLKPLIPAPFADLSVLVLTGLFGIWQLVKARRLKTVGEQIKLGAKITAQTVDQVVKPSVEIWEKFKTAQKEASKKTAAIMPDKIP